MGIPDIVSVKIRLHDIIDYVVGLSKFHPIEKYIDFTQYEICSASILNLKTKEVVEQDSEFQSFYRQLDLLKKKAPNMDMLEIERICEELEEIAPTIIYL